MSVLAAILVLALTRAEIIERFKAAPITKVDGMVRVFADCPADMRREYQGPVSTYLAGVLTTLYSGNAMRPVKFEEPAIDVHLGDVRTNLAAVAVKVVERDDATKVTKIYIPAPGFADMEKLRRETVKAFFRAVKGEELDDAAAEKALVDADPELRADLKYRELARWCETGEGGEDDEYYLKLARSVIAPGVARASDVLRFAARLRLYPPVYDAPFCGKYRDLAFKDAIENVDADFRIRFAAYSKAPLVVAFGGGRGEELSAAAEAYSKFLFDLAAMKKTKDELRDELEAADTLLNVALEKARENGK